MAIYLKWHMCPYHEPLVAQIPILSNTLQTVGMSIGRDDVITSSGGTAWVSWTNEGSRKIIS